MADPPKEDKKPDLSSLPRGAISIKGLPVNRNTRLPSIRSPRDLTLGGPPKRTFMPNIPVRREKKPQLPEDITPKIENIKTEKKSNPHQNEKGKGRGRNKQIIQTEGSLYSQALHAPKKERAREAYLKSEHSSTSKGVNIKKENKDFNIDEMSKEFDSLYSNNFIDDDEDDDNVMKPTVFPFAVKKEEKSDPSTQFNPDIAKELGFDVNLVAKFIKKEEEPKVEEKMKIDEPAGISSNEVVSLLRGETSSNLMLLQFPDLINLTQKMDESEPSSHKKTNNADSKASNDQEIPGNIYSLPEGYIGKLQVTKSGKVKLIIGTVQFKLDPIECKLSQYEVASISTKPNAKDLTILGQIKHKLVFAPDEDCLIT